MNPLTSKGVQDESNATGRLRKESLREPPSSIAAQEGANLASLRPARTLSQLPLDLLSPVATTQPAHPSKPFSVISMFSGCGGMDLGFKGGFKFLGQSYTELPFEIVWANDFNRAACATYRRNIGDHIRLGDVWDHLSSMPANADVIIGGFPCQDISVNGKRRGVAGERSGLYRAMVEAVSRVRPSIFVAENVKGLLMKYNESSLQTVLSDFSSLGYRVTYNLYQAADYGVPQTRERVFIIGIRDSNVDFLQPQATTPRPFWISASTAIGDLEQHPEDIDINHIWSRANKSPDQGSRRLVAERPGYTIRAECHGNIQFHYGLDRRISMREAARFQSFPDDFVFESKLRETERQVGNAVPPVLAWHIAREVAAALAESSPLPKALEQSSSASG